eukprot:TRINITY_DN10141_c0_g1_i2.p3 TRINITY_DN10141_c0_g1~~TRINITY_DN10141_c0_g1_i2.p3  ORF type:complete len:151 (-),score=11.48 TRINITY_DN10141_c0_g1_i2:56-508(-)
MIIPVVLLLLIQGTMESNDDLQVAIQLMGEEIEGGYEGGVVQQSEDEVIQSYKPRRTTYTKIPIKIKPEITQQTTLPTVREVITQPPINELLPIIEIPFYPPTYPPVYPPTYEFEPIIEIPFPSVYPPIYPPVYPPGYGVYPPLYGATWV